MRTFVISPCRGRSQRTGAAFLLTLLVGLGTALACSATRVPRARPTDERSHSGPRAIPVAPDQNADAARPFEHPSPWNPQIFQEILPWFEPGSYTASLRSRPQPAGEAELEIATGYVAELFRERRPDLADRAQALAFARKNHPSLRTAAQPGQPQTHLERFTLGGWGFLHESSIRFDGGQVFVWAQSWNEGEHTTLETRYGDGTDAELVAMIHAREDNPSEHYTGSIYPFWDSIQRARLIVAVLSPERTFGRDIDSPVDESRVLFQRSVAATDPEWRHLEESLVRTVLLPSNGVFVLGGSSMQCSLRQEGSKLIWEEVWREPGNLPLVEWQITWESSRPVTARERRYLVGTKLCYKEINVAAQFERGPHPDEQRVPSLRGATVYDFRTDPPKVSREE